MIDDWTGTLVEPHVVTAGAGPGVVCLHSNASTSAQWSRLMTRLAPSFRVSAVDLYGAGGSPAWSQPGPFRLSDEVDLIEPVLADAAPLALVGHSYGAAVALMAALRKPDRVKALALYEPTLFALIDAERPRPNDADGIRQVLARARRSLEDYDTHGAAETFIDYWSGPGAWSRIPSQRRNEIAFSMLDAARWAEALFCEPATLDAFRSLEVPVLYMVGRSSTPAALAVARILTRALPRVQVVEFDVAGHMGPVSHSGAVNEAVAAFLQRHHA